MDPISAIAVATTAFEVIKKGISFGKDVESMYSDVGRWMGAISDLDHAEKMNKKPPIFKKLFNGSSIEQEAMDIFAAKKKAEQVKKAAEAAKKAAAAKAKKAKKAVKKVFSTKKKKKKKH